MSVRPNMPARAAAALLVVHGFTGAPVVTAEGLLRGIVTEADLMRGQPLPHLEDADTTQDATAGEVMTPDPTTMRPVDDLSRRRCPDARPEEIVRCRWRSRTGQLVGTERIPSGRASGQQHQDRSSTGTSTSVAGVMTSPAVVLLGWVLASSRWGKG